MCNTIIDMTDGSINFIIFNWLCHVKTRIPSINIQTIMYEIDTTIGTQLLNLENIVVETDTDFTNIHEEIIDKICEMYAWAKELWIEYLGTNEDIIIEKQCDHWIIVGTNYVVESPKHRVVNRKLIDGHLEYLDELDIKILDIKDVPYKDVKSDYKISNDQEYNNIIYEIKNVAKLINIIKDQYDGRIDSAIKEIPFLKKLKYILLQKHPDWNIVISPPRAVCDIMINSIRINLKLTDCNTSDNCVNKSSIYYSITGLTTYPYSSNWNEFLDRLVDAKYTGKIKTVRHKPTEYHYLVKNKLTGDVLCKPIFDIHTYISNASNDLQINWKNEFIHLSYETKNNEYLKKVQSLLTCIQKSLLDRINRSIKFASMDFDEIFRHLE
jgi:hypothetical protein